LAANAVALLFPGQASQYVGMGRALFEASEDVRSIFERVEYASGVEVRRICFEGPEEELAETPNLQPCMLAMGMAAWTFLKSRIPIAPVCAAGHSLGEYTALVAAGAMELEDAAMLVRERGRLMQMAVPKGLGAMAALRGLDPDMLDSVLRRMRRLGDKVWQANFNGGGQVVISGLVDDLEKALVELKNAGARRAVMLPVTAPFHSPLMEPAAKGLQPFMEKIEISHPEYPVYCNVTAMPHTSGESIAARLIDQIISPVLWETTIENMAESGVEVAIECGAGKVLTNLLKRTTDKIRCAAFEKPDDLEQIEEILG